jgi:segregation and condensation protein A
MNQTPASEAIALLINLAQTGEIDPWDVQVIEVIDRFLEELGLHNPTDVTYLEADLPQSGQVILWASMLVLLKADTLEKLEREEQEQEQEELEMLANSEQNRAYLPTNLENQIRRRTSAPPLKKRRVTLPELIAQLQQIAGQLETTTSSPTLSKGRQPSRREAMNTITQLAHNENLTELAGQLEKFLNHELPLLVGQPTSIDLEKLLHWWGDSNDHQSKDRVGVFWALLLLSSQSKVELSQTEFYQDLHISII